MSNMVLDRGVIHQILATTIVLSNGLMRGITIGWVAPTLVKLRKGEYDLTATNRELSWVASVHALGRFFGPLLMAVILDRVGRKPSIMIGCFSFVTLWLLMVFVRSVILIIILRLLMGAILGMLDVVNFVYLAENCSPQMRGILGSFILLCSNTGTLVENILTSYTSFSTAATANVIICLCLTLTTFFTKETPYFLVMKGRHEKAKRNLLWLRGQSTPNKETTVELEKIQQNMQSEMSKKKSLAMTLQSPENYRPVLMITISSSLLLSAGSTAIGAYSSMIFQPSSILSSKEFTIFMALIDLTCSFIFPFVVEKFNRRTLLLKFFIIISISNACAFFLFSMEFELLKECLSWIIFTVVTLNYVISGWAMNVLGIMRGEILPISVKGIGSCLGVMIISLATGISTGMFLPISTTFGIQYNFILFFISSSITLIHVYRVLPETKGKTLVDIQSSLQKSLLNK